MLLTELVSLGRAIRFRAAAATTTDIESSISRLNERFVVVVFFLHLVPLLFPLHSNAPQ